VLVEPIQGGSGVHVLSEELLKTAREACDAHGAALVFDEVQCGMGRTGRLFAHEWEGVAPDIMAVAKALGGGFPIGACLATERAAAGMTARTHGSTFGGNPLGVAAGNAVPDLLLAPGFFEHAEAMGNVLRGRLQEATPAPS